MDVEQQNVFRYKFSSDLVEKINYFSKLHALDDRKTYKEEWNKWVQTKEMFEIIDAETERLSRLGYRDDINDKMYRSSRYYFRKKKDNDNKTRATFVRSKVNVSKEFVDKMKELIESKKSDSNFSPKNGYQEFINNNNQYNEEVQNLMQNGFSSEDAVLKVKKTFKNQYFQIGRAHV